MKLCNTVREHGTLRPASRSKWISKAAAVTAGLAMTAASVSAAIVAVWPAVVGVPPPASVVLDQQESDTAIIAFNERQCFWLPAGGLDTDQRHLPGNLRVSCHLLHMDPASPPVLLSGRARFDSMILGVISDSDLLDASDDICKRLVPPVTTYPPLGTEPDRGLESTQPDQYQISPNGFAIQVEMNARGASDQVRVITRCD